MATLVKDERIASDSWQRLEGGAARWLTVGEDGFVPDFPAQADLIAPLALLKVRGEELLGRTGRTACCSSAGRPGGDRRETGAVFASRVRFRSSSMAALFSAGLCASAMAKRVSARRG